MKQDWDDITFEIDHIISESHGGLTQPGNLALACFHNSFKGANLAEIDRRSGRIVPLFNPRRQNWSQRFQWCGPHVRGRTGLDALTVAVLPERAEPSRQASGERSFRRVAGAFQPRLLRKLTIRLL
jgi:hypothetical protein